MSRLFLLLALALSASPALAQTCTTEWAAPVDGSWTEATNWTNGVPAEGGTPCITVAGTYTVELGGTTISLSGFVLGGRSGTQTLISGIGFVSLTVTDEARIAPNGRLEVRNGSISNTDGLYVDGTLLVEGTLVASNPSRFFSTGGLLDIAPGGTLLVAANNVGSAQATFRVRGLLEAECGTCNVNARLDARGGTIRAASGRLDIESGGTIDGLTVDVAEGVELNFLSPGGAGPHYVVEGTVSGTPAGNMFWTNVEFAAGPAGATLAVGGTGVQTFAGSGRRVDFTSTGGAFTNTGLLRTFGNGLWLGAATLQNEGRIEMDATLRMEESARLDNLASGDLVLLNGTGIRGGPDGGRLTGAGRIAAVTSGRASITVPVDLDGATVAVEDAERLQLCGGALRDVSFDVASGSAVWFTTSNCFEGNTGVFEVGGTLTGTIEGDLLLTSGGSFAGAMGGGTLAFGGTGLRVSPGSGQSSFFTSQGGSLLNTGLVTVEGNGLRVSESIVRNQGEVRVRGNLILQAGGTFVNEAGGVTDFQDAGDATSPDDTGRLINEGLIVSSGSGRSSLSPLRSRTGSEVRTLGGAETQIFPPGSASTPAGATLTGAGRVLIPSTLEIEGTVSPGTEAEPFGTLEIQSFFYPSPVAGSPRLVVDVGAGGQSDRLEVLSATGTSQRSRLNGVLIVRMAEGYTPQIGDEFTVLRSQGVIGGQFDQVVADGAPNGIAFVAEVVPFDGSSEAVVLRAVEVAPGGPITVSTEATVGGAERSIFLSGPGASGVTAARLDCTTCLDPDAFGSISAEIVAIGSVRELRFDLTAPRAFGFYDLILQSPGLPDEVVPVTVRPYLAFVLSQRGLVRGARVRPDGQNYNYTDLNMELRTNDAAPAFHVPSVERTTPLYDLALASGNAFAINNFVFYESDFAADPTRAPVVLGRLTEGRYTRLAFGLRIAPEDVLFPGEEPTGPDDPRLPWGDPTQFVAAFGPIHFSTARTARVLSEALRTSGNEALSTYIALVDAADPDAVAGASRNTLQLDRRSYYAGLTDVLDVLLGRLDATVPVPPGLADAAGLDFELAVEAASVAYAIDIERAHLDAIREAPPEVGTLITDEIEALFPEGIPGGEEVAPAAPRTRSGQTTTFRRDFIGDVRCRFDSDARDVAAILDSMEGENAGQGEIPGGFGGGGGGTGCPQPPEGSADPNDKTTSPSLTCETGIVIVDGEEETRCIRHFVPISQATDPLVYNVRFENLPAATANAEFVTITDELDPNLDPATLEVLTTSSDSTFSYSVSGQTVTFRFVGIDLPPNRTPPEGEGFVSFSVQPRAGLAAGTEIRNDASIVFDFNPEIVTPEVVHELREVADLAVLLDAPEQVVTGTPFAFSTTATNLRGDAASETVLTLSPPAGMTVLGVTPSAGTCEGVAPIVCQLGTLESGDEVTIDVTAEPMSTGASTIAASITSNAFDGFEPNDTDAASVGVVVVGVEDDESGFPREVRLSSVAPNPVRSTTTIRWGVPVSTGVDLRVYDLRGREVAVLAEGEHATAGWHETTWRPDLASGVYLVRLMAGSEVRTKKLLVVR